MTEYVSYTATSDKALMRTYFKNREGLEKIRLSDHQVKVISRINTLDEPSITSKILSDSMRISLQSASSQLSRLWHKGYLERRSVVQESGGVEHRYKLSIKV